MAILVVGSVAFDSIETPHGKVDHCLGGAATHFALAASYFTDVRVIAVVGEDFLPEHEAVFTKRGIDTRGIERAPGLTFHWTGAYAGNLSEAQTLGTDLNVFERFEPKIPEAYEDSEYLFLANIDPVLQARVRSQMKQVRMVCGDTMNYWIKDHAANLKKVLRELDVLLINDGEARMLSGETNAVRAAENVLAMGPKGLGAGVRPGEGAEVAGGKARGVRRDGVFWRACVPRKRNDPEAVPGAGAAAGRGGGPDGRGRFVCRRVLRVSRSAAGVDAGGVSQGDVLDRKSV